MCVPWLSVTLLLAVFVTDACSLPGRGAWRWQIIPPGFGERLARLRHPYALATAGSLMILLVWLMGPGGYQGTTGALNCIAVVGILWLAAEHIVRRKVVEEDIQRLRDSFEQRVQERTAQLEAANRELDAFSYSVAHDLRAPLRAVGGLTQVLQEDHGSQLADEGRRLLGQVDGEVRRMRQLIDDLLEFSRQGRREVHLADVDMAELAREVFADLHGLTVQRRVNLHLEGLPHVQADAALLRHVWFNLLENALKFTRHRPLAEIKIEASHQGSDIVFSIQDNGAGFDMQHVDRLFHAFERLHDPGEFEGTGVGLALVQRIVRRHGGRVWAEAQLGRGATFYFTLPHSRSAPR